MIGIIKLDGKSHRNIKLNLDGDTSTAFFHRISEHNEEDFLTLLSVKADFYDAHMEFRGFRLIQGKDATLDQPVEGCLYEYVKVTFRPCSKVKLLQSVALFT